MPPSRWTLYVAGPTHEVAATRASLERLRNEGDLPSGPLDVVDVLSDPERARRDGVLVTPCLIAGDALHGARVFGDLDDPRKLRWSLGLTDRNPS